MRIWNAVENASDHETIQLFADGDIYIYLIHNMNTNLIFLDYAYTF